MARHGEFKAYPTRASADRILDNAYALAQETERLQALLDTYLVTDPPPSTGLGHVPWGPDRTRSIMDDLCAALDRLASPVMESKNTGHDERIAR